MFTPRTKVCLFSNSLQNFPFAVVYDETIVSTGAREFVEMSGKVVDCLENNVFNSRLKSELFTNSDSHVSADVQF